MPTVCYELFSRKNEKHIKNIIESSFGGEKHMEEKPVATSYNNMLQKNGRKALSSKERNQDLRGKFCQWFLACFFTTI